jgi:phosphate transport system permease protein
MSISIRRARRSAANALFVAFCVVVTAIALTSLALILWSLVVNNIKGAEVWNLALFTHDLPTEGSPGGLRNAILGSIFMCAGGMAIAVVVGVLAGTWLAEYAADSHYGHAVRFVNDVLLSAPSILVGLFVYGILVSHMIGHFSAIAGAVALAVLAVPVVTRTTEDILRLQSNALREAGVALGSPQWTTIRKIVWRAARGGMLTGALLAFARISGETAPLLFTALSNNFNNWDPTKPVASLPVVIFNFAMGPYDDLHAYAWAAAALVSFTVLSINIIGRIITAREHHRS